MTQEAEKNLNYVKDSATYAGFGTEYHKAIEDGIKSGKRELDLPLSYKQYDEHSAIMFKPKVIETDGTPGYYNFKGFHATLGQEGKDPTTQFFSTYKMTGVTAEQAHTLLTGGTVLQTDWDNREGARRQVFVKLDLSKPVAEGENYPVIRINSKDLDLARLYSKMDIVASQDEKERHLRLLQTGSSVMVRAWDQSDSGSNRTVQYNVRLNLLDEKTMELKATDMAGKSIPSPTIEAKSKQSNQLVGLTMGKDNEKKLPDAIMKLLHPKGSPAGGMTVGGPDGGKTQKRA